MANIKISELNELTKSNEAYDDYLPIVDTSANETKKISVENLIANNVYLLAVVKANGQVPTPVAGAKYYNEVQNKIYYAPDDEHWYEYGTPVEGIFYIVLGEKGNYAYDSENETLVSVGGGSGSEIVIGDEEPTEDTKMIIDTDAFDPQYSDITDEYSEANNKAYSCGYINNMSGNIVYGTINSSTTVANNTIEISGNISLTPGTYIIEGTLNLFSTTGTRWINLAIGTNAFAQAYIEGVYGSVIGIIHLDNNATVNLQIANYTGSTITYTPHSSDKLVAVKISN